MPNVAVWGLRKFCRLIRENGILVVVSFHTIDTDFGLCEQAEIGNPYEELVRLAGTSPEVQAAGFQQDMLLLHI